MLGCVGNWWFWTRSRAHPNSIKPQRATVLEDILEHFKAQFQLLANSAHPQSPQGLKCWISSFSWQRCAPLDGAVRRVAWLILLLVGNPRWNSSLRWKHNIGNLQTSGVNQHDQLKDLEPFFAASPWKLDWRTPAPKSLFSDCGSWGWFKHIDYQHFIPSDDQNCGLPLVRSFYDSPPSYPHPISQVYTPTSLFFSKKCMIHDPVRK